MAKNIVKPEILKALINDLIDRGFVSNNSEFAARINIPRSSISDIFSGRTQLNLDKLISISHQFNILFTIKNGALDYQIIDESEKIDPLFQESINYLKHFAQEHPEKTTKFIKSLTDLLQE